MNEQFSIAGKVAVITGAGGVLGGSIAKCFMEQGAKVVAVDIRQEQLDKRVEELKAYGEDVIGIVGNVLDIASLEKLADDSFSTNRISVVTLNRLYVAMTRSRGNLYLMRFSTFKKIRDSYIKV